MNPCCLHGPASFSGPFCWEDARLLAPATNGRRNEPSPQVGLDEVGMLSGRVGADYEHAGFTFGATARRCCGSGLSGPRIPADSRLVRSVRSGGGCAKTVRWRLARARGSRTVGCLFFDEGFAF